MLQLLSGEHTQTVLVKSNIADNTIQDLDTIVSSKISLEMESLKICKESLISMEISTFDRLRSGLNSFHGELL